ncbi:hypothetical protein TARUN_567 [Trichoderma arundinaceum]|uniref:Uncharacterized protein n=1 Tax=Trichoderma arundinaceum TaxID=490622 RepID=A0A395NZZ1_TRIAR|nr:hypothetical protein TARUN_567 [Trichoderma arundinaceum]
MNSNSNNSSESSNNMSLIGHHGGVQIGKAERPGPSLGTSSKDHKSKPSSSSSSSSRSQTLDRRGFGQMIDGILHSQRRDEAQARASALAYDRSDAASISSVATEKRALLGGKSSSSSKSSSGKESKLPNINESMIPRARFWS